MKAKAKAKAEYYSQGVIECAYSTLFVRYESYQVVFISKRMGSCSGVGYHDYHFR